MSFIGAGRGISSIKSRGATAITTPNSIKVACITSTPVTVRILSTQMMKRFLVCSTECGRLKVRQ